MGVSRTWAVALSGLEGTPVEVEADQSPQIPDFRIIGLADRALNEAVQRVRNATQNSGLELARRRLTVNLSPANLPKQGSGFDVSIAIAALATDGGMDEESLATAAHIGELGLDGRLRPVPGVLPAVVAAARAGLRTVVVPWACRDEAALVPGIRVVPAVGLADVARLHGAEVDDAPHLDPVTASTTPETATGSSEPLDLADVIGQRDAVEALVVAAAGGHHMLMSGPPGAGKTMLARRLPGILPPLDDRAALAVASIRSLCGMRVHGLDRTAPFEAPHHTASVAALVGGGSRIVRPGAVARASEGILFLDEAGEHRSGSLDALRQPLESGSIMVQRAGFTATFPARFQLILATNPCPCGNHGVKGAVCECAPAAIRRYRRRLSGPLLDRIDIEAHMHRVTTLVDATAERTTSAQARSRVMTARTRSAARLAATPWRLNRDVGGEWLRRGPLAPDRDVYGPLELALRRGALSQRGCDRVLRVAWSVADLAGHDRLTPHDVGRALYLKKGIQQ